MTPEEIKTKIKQIMASEPCFVEDAYVFVANSVSFTVSRLAAHRHVSARELLAGVRDFAQQEFGVLAYEVLHEWGIRSAADVGRIVYLMIGAGLLSASDQDSPEDFDIDFNLADAPAETSGGAGQLPTID